MSSSSSSSWRPGSAASDAASQSDPFDVEEEVFVAAMNSPVVQILGATRAVDASVREITNVSSPETYRNRSLWEAARLDHQCITQTNESAVELDEETAEGDGSAVEAREHTPVGLKSE